MPRLRPSFSQTSETRALLDQPIDGQGPNAAASQKAIKHIESAHAASYRLAFSPSSFITPLPTMTRTVQILQPGSPDAMQLTETQVGDPGPGEIRIRHHAIGLNYIDVYQRSGVYPLPMPLKLGMEGAGVVEAVGDGVTHLSAGDRAAYASQPPGSYCDVRVMPAKNVCKLPDSIDFETAAAMMLKGLTTQYLLRKTQPQGGLKAGDFVLFHAAAGGVGLIACQWAKAMGLQLIGTANYATDDFVTRVKEITGGKGVKVVYDSVGASTFAGSLDCLSPFGLLASFGNASGKVPPVDIGTLGAKGSLYISRPTLFTHIATRESTQTMFEDLAQMVTSGAVKIPVTRRYALADVAQAHRDLEARVTTGACVLLP
jgi:NADPH:quinone reductase